MTAPVTPAVRVRSLLRRVWAVIALPLIAIVLALLVGAVIILASELVIPGQPFDPLLPGRAYIALLQGAIGLPPAVNPEARQGAADAVVAVQECWM